MKKKLTITQINEIESKITVHDHDKYVSTPEFNKLPAENFAATLKQPNFASKINIVNFVKKADLIIN